MELTLSLNVFHILKTLIKVKYLYQVSKDYVCDSIIENENFINVRPFSSEIYFIILSILRPCRGYTYTGW